MSSTTPMSSTPASSRVSAQSIPLDGDGELARVAITVELPRVTNGTTGAHGS